MVVHITVVLALLIMQSSGEFSLNYASFLVFGEHLSVLSVRNTKKLKSCVIWVKWIVGHYIYHLFGRSYLYFNCLDN